MTNLLKSVKRYVKPSHVSLKVFTFFGMESEEKDARRLAL